MDIIDWLLNDSDPSLKYQVSRDLLHQPESKLRALQIQIENKGHGKYLLDKRNQNGHWGNGVYNPKWICTHYVVFELIQINISPTNKKCYESTELLLNQPIGIDGGINYAKTVKYSDVCINGMLLYFASYFRFPIDVFSHIIDFILNVKMQDGGWNCEYFNRATHSSLHTTISVLEGLSQYILINQYTYRKQEIIDSIYRGNEFILDHELYKSSTTGEVIKDDFFKYYFPIRWKYDILRCLDYFQKNNVQYDDRMYDAINIIKNSKNSNSQWKGFSQPGKVFLLIDKNCSPSKWNTLRAFRVLNCYKDCGQNE